MSLHDILNEHKLNQKFHNRSMNKFRILFHTDFGKMTTEQSTFLHRHCINLLVSFLVELNLLSGDLFALFQLSLLLVYHDLFSN